MGASPGSAIRWLFDAPYGGAAHGAEDLESAARSKNGRLIPRWLFLRALGAIYFSAFFSLAFQIRGLIGPDGILPARGYLQAVAQSLGHWRFWYAPTLLWWSSGSAMLNALCWVGMAASILVVLNFWPRGMVFVCFVCFLSFVSAAQDFSGYQSDGMLLEAGFISLFFAPSGFRPGLARGHPASRASLFLLLWEWFRIYFESGVVKLVSGDVEWRNFTAMDEYYQNGPLPTWIGWYVQHFPHWFHAATVFATLALELVLVWMLFLPRRWRIVCFFIVTPWQIGVILTANYTFLNYLVLVLGVLLLDDRFVLGILSAKWFPESPAKWLTNSKDRLAAAISRSQPGDSPQPSAAWWKSIQRVWRPIRISATAIMLTWIFYVTTAEMVFIFGRVPLPTSPIAALEPFRIANQYGLFAVMTRGRYEIEFQGSNDGQNWIAYPFRYKPQALNQPPGVYAPYQPRFDWNLWFASLGEWREYSIVPNTEVRLLSNDKDVLQLFAGNPFSSGAPRQIRAVLWQYWFTTRAEKRSTGMWWRREFLGLYAPTIERTADNQIKVIEWPNVEPRE
jgi:lipase maturation factor 1